MYIKLLSTGACANINIREIMLLSIISSASWTLQLPLTLGYWTAPGSGAASNAELLGGQHKSMELPLTLRYWAVPESGGTSNNEVRDCSRDRRSEGIARGCITSDGEARERVRVWYT